MFQAELLPMPKTSRVPEGSCGPAAVQTANSCWVPIAFTSQLPTSTKSYCLDFEDETASGSAVRSASTASPEPGEASVDGSSAGADFARNDSIVGAPAGGAPSSVK